MVAGDLLYHETSRVHVMDDQSSSYSMTNLFTVQGINS